jgi:hypothetical protein
MEQEGSLPCPQEPSTALYPKPNDWLAAWDRVIEKPLVTEKIWNPSVLFA